MAALDFNSSNVFLMARSVNPYKQSIFDIDFSYVEDKGVNAGMVIGVFLLVVVLIIALTSMVLFILHRAEIVDVYVPHFLRILCLSGYLTREEMEAFGHDE